MIRAEQKVKRAASMIDLEQIGQLIKQGRREKGLTQQQLADRLGVTNKAVSKWELGDSFS